MLADRWIGTCRCTVPEDTGLPSCVPFDNSPPEVYVYKPQDSRSLSDDSASEGNDSDGGPQSAVKWVSSRALESGAPRRRVLAYGDSLTAGFYNGGKAFAPYAEALGLGLLPDLSTDICVCGVNGLTAEKMVAEKDSSSIRDGTGRYGKGISRMLADKGPFDIVVIMAGTNDLAFTSAHTIFANLRALHEACHYKNVRTVALGIPPSLLTLQHPMFSRRRGAVNALLENYAKRLPSAGRMTTFIDTEVLVPFCYAVAGEFSGSNFWEKDGLHMTKDGSCELGTKLSEHLKELLLESSGNLTSPTSSKHPDDSKRKSQCTSECLWSSIPCTP